MEDLAFLVMGIMLGLLALGVTTVVLAIFARKGRISKYWPIGLIAVLVGLGIAAWQGSDRLAMIPLGLAAISLAITFWPKAN
jgi:uncharacterized YccA/Bax inhibitor family protein